MSFRYKLLKFAEYTAYPYVMNLDFVKQHKDFLSVSIVGLMF